MTGMAAVFSDGLRSGKELYDNLKAEKDGEIAELRGRISLLEKGLRKAIYYAKPPMSEVIDYKILEEILEGSKATGKGEGKKEEP